MYFEKLKKRKNREVRETNREVRARLGYDPNSCKHPFCTGRVCMEFSYMLKYKW